MIKKEINLKHENDLNLLVLATFRYSLGKMTYMTLFFGEFIENNIDITNDNTLNTIIEEIKSCKDYGMDCDEEMWLDLKEKLEKYLDSKNKKRG